MAAEVTQNPTQKHGLYVKGEFLRLASKDIKAKDGTTFTKHEVHVLVNGEKISSIYEINTRHPERFKNKTPGEIITLPVYLTARAYQGRAYVSYYELD